MHVPSHFNLVSQADVIKMVSVSAETIKMAGSEPLDYFVTYPATFGEMRLESPNNKYVSVGTP